MNSEIDQSDQQSTFRLAPVPGQALFSDPEYYTWGGSMVRDADGQCHLFYSRWKKEFGFNAWVTHSEIAHAVADDPLGPYHHVDIALSDRGDEFWDGHCTHNPTVLEHEGSYYLYYMGNCGDGKLEADETSWNWSHRNSQRIGLAVADDPSGPWKRWGEPLLDVGEAEDADALMVSNPAVMQRADGRFQIIYKAVGLKEALPFGGPVVHLVALADTPVGPFVKQAGTLFSRDDVTFPAEDPYVWCQDGIYFGILKDVAGYFSEAGRSLVLFESKDGFDWRKAENCLISDRTVQFEDGSIVLYDFLERPQLYLEEGKPSVLFCAARRGDETYNIHIPIKQMESR